ncbi:MAG: hypothetical protein KDB01_26180 [Planctomycetaceae bacterium]|nr:hypothetical protein [Planctomycetaceae bacterium]
MSVRNKYLPYVRRGNGREVAEGFASAFRLAFYQTLCPRRYYVMVQRGFPNVAIGVGRSKREVQQEPCLVSLRAYSFREWAKMIQRLATIERLRFEALNQETAS